MKNYNEMVYVPTLEKYGFKKIETDKYCKIGTTWKIPDTLGTGYYWSYDRNNLFSIDIHDFVFNDEQIISGDTNEFISITYIYNADGKLLSAKGDINADSILVYSGNTTFKYRVSGAKRLKSVGIQIMPNFYNKYLLENYNVSKDEFKEAIEYYSRGCKPSTIKSILLEIEDYRGDNPFAGMFYEAKVKEIIAIILKSYKTIDYKSSISKDDIKAIMDVCDHIKKNLNNELRLKELCKIACMGLTKLKESFKTVTNNTITEYIQKERINEAIILISKTNLSMAEISSRIGYESQSRFIELFKRYNGITPKEYQRLITSEKCIII